MQGRNVTESDKWFGLGAIPKKLRPVLETEHIVVADEGMGGRFICRDVKGPGKRYTHRSEGFFGCLVVTKKRIICFTFGKRQINIAADDPKVSEFLVDIPEKDKLSISFEASAFRTGWEGVMMYHFNTNKAQEFLEVLTSMGARQGH